MNGKERQTTLGMATGQKEYAFSAARGKA